MSAALDREMEIMRLERKKGEIASADEARMFHDALEFKAQTTMAKIKAVEEQYPELKKKNPSGVISAMPPYVAAAQQSYVGIDFLISVVVIATGLSSASITNDYFMLRDNPFLLHQHWLWWGLAFYLFVRLYSAINSAIGGFLMFPFKLAGKIKKKKKE